MSIGATGYISGDASLELSEKARPTVSEVSDAIAVTILVSPLTINSSPIETSDKNAVPEPGTVVLAAGSIEPVKVVTAAAFVNLIYKPNPPELLSNAIPS